MGIKQQVSKRSVTAKFVKWSAALCVVLAFSLPPFGSARAVGATRYVSAATGVDDAASVCDSALAPCLTINYAISKAVAGDTIKVATGTYTSAATEVVLIDKSVDLSGGWNSDFTSQDGMATIDGQNARRGIDIGNSSTAALDHFVVQHGYDHWTGAGILASGTLTLSDSIVQNNSSDSVAGGIHYYGYPGSHTLTLNNTAVIGNNAGDQGGGLVITGGTLILNNTTWSGNHSDSWGSAIYGDGGEITMNNSTVTGNTGVDAVNVPNSVLTMRNSIVAGNTLFGNPADCSGSIQSAGYNLIGVVYSRCTFNSTTGDMVGTASAPIDPKLGPLTDNGGRTPTRALLPGSPAINAGNPAVPGEGDPDACVATDQRGLPRPAPTGGRCDIGAYEAQYPVVKSIHRVGASPTGATSVDYLVTFSGDVTGVDTEAPFNDFALTASGVTGAAITAVSGSGSSYTVTANTGTGIGTLRLDVIDDDTIVDVTSGEPLGGLGTSNGNFTSGQAYTLQKPVVSSITRVNPNPTRASSEEFTVTFSEPVTGVDTTTPFGDFSLTTTGVTDASIKSVSGSGETYTVTVGTGTGNGTIRLDVVDNDSIRDSRRVRLGGSGAGIGNFTAGEVYAISKSPAPWWPAATVWDTTPTFQWRMVPGATQYRYELVQGTPLLYTKTVSSAACNTTSCSLTPTRQLIPGSYKWRAQAFLGGAWKSYTPYRTFLLIAPKAGHWKSPSTSWDSVDFYVGTDRVSVNRFGLWFYVDECRHGYKVVNPASVPIYEGGVFTFSALDGSFWAYGTFANTSTNIATASGTVHLRSYFVTGCGSISGDEEWTARWLDSSQPPAASVLSSGDFVVTPMLDMPLDPLNAGTFHMDP